MSLGSRRASRHDTEAQRKLGGVRSEDYWDHRPGQRVMTCDGVPGVVVAVLDGFHPGNESYEVRLDGGMGGGLYASGQLRSAQGQVEAGSAQSAATDYPELSTVLRERPDPALDQVMSRKQAGEESSEAELVNPGIGANDPELNPDEVQDDFEPRTASSDDYALLAEAMAQGASDSEVDNLIAAAGLRALAYANSPWGDPAPSRVTYQPGPTSPRDPGQNPASSGPLSAADPDGWNRGPLPIRVVPLDSSYATLHDDPEPALPTTDGADEDSDQPTPRQAALASAFLFESDLTRQASPTSLLAAAPEMLGAEEVGTGGGEPKSGAADQDAGSTPTPDPNQTGEQAIRDPAVTSRAGLNLEPDLDPTDDVMTDLVPKAASVDEVVAQFQATAAGRMIGQGVKKEALKDFSFAEQRELINEGQGVRAGNLDRLDVTGTHYAQIPDEEEATWMA